MLKKLWCLLLIVFMLASTFVFADENFIEAGFTQKINRTAFFGNISEWATEEIENAHKKNLIPETFFGKDLDVPVSRGEFAAVAVTLYEKLTDSEIAYQNTPFCDIKGNLNETYIKKAYAAGITAGVSDTQFDPDAFISREQFATMLCRVFKKYVYPDWNLSNDQSYPLFYAAAQKFDDDSDISGYAKEAVYFLSLHSVVMGVGDNRFNGSDEKNFATREQAISLSLRCTEFLFTKEIMADAKRYPSVSVTNKIPGIHKFILDSPEDLSEVVLYDNIKYLKIDSANISDFIFLKDLNISLLQVLYNEQSPLDFSCINAEEIEQLYLLNVDIVNTEAAADFQNLFYFVLKHGANQPQLTNLDFLSECTKMREIQIQNYGITNLDFAKNMSNLQELSVIHSSLEDMSGLSNCSALSSLTLSCGKLKDISAVGNLKNLRSLDLSDNYIENADAACGLLAHSLSNLNLSDNFIAEVNLTHTPNTDIRLDVSHNYISRLPKELLDFSEVNLSGNNICELSEEVKAALRTTKCYINLYDNLLDEDTIREIARNDYVYFGQYTVDQAVEFTNQIKKILSFLETENDYKKVYQIVNGVTNSIRLDFSSQTPHKDAAYGALFEKTVCTGSTDLTNALCRHSGIRVKQYHGDFGDINNGERHVWTLVQIDGNFYHCDAMQNKGKTDPLPYILLSDDEMKKYPFLLDALNVFACEMTISKADREALQQGYVNWLQKNNMRQFNFQLLD